MTKGSCVCGAFTYEFEGEPASVAICHCIPCRKTAGANGSYNWIVSEAQVKQLTGTAKPFTRTGDSGKDIGYSLCDVCGTIMWRTLGVAPGMLVLKAGTLDDRTLEERVGAPQSEIYTRNRPGWCTAWEGVAQKEAAT